MHDRKKHPLKVGDVVVVPAVITSVSEGEFCSLTVKTKYPMPGNGEPTTITLNTKQVYKVLDGTDGCPRNSDGTPQPEDKPEYAGE